MDGAPEGRRAWRWLAAAALVVIAGCGGGSSVQTNVTPVAASPSPEAAAITTASPTPTTGESPEAALRRQFDELMNKGQFGREWDELHPAQQAIVSRDQYIQCGAKRNLPNIDSVDVVETYQEDVAVPSTSLRSASVALTVKLKLSNGLLSRDETSTFHEFQVDGQWKWSLSAPEDYASGKCPLV